MSQAAGRGLQHARQEAHLDEQPDQPRLHICPDEAGVQVTPHCHIQHHNIPILLEAELPLALIALALQLAVLQCMGRDW